MDDAGSNPRAVGVALLEYVADVLVGQAVELAAHPKELRRLLAQIDAVAPLPRAALARAVLGDARLLQLQSAVAIEVLLGLLLALAEARFASVWTRERERAFKEIAHAGDVQPSAADSRRVTRASLGMTPKPESVPGLVALRIEPPGRPPAALVVHGRTATARSRRSILEAAIPMLAAMLERDQLLNRGSRSPDVVIAAAERRLARLRFDLHDGPQQDVVLLADDLQLLRSQLEALLDGEPNKSRVLGRLDDLQARLVAIDGDLRRISSFVQSPFMSGASLPAALSKVVEEFSARAGIEPELELDGEFGTLSDSQQITLLGLVREALSNVREHSNATHVRVAVSAGPEGVRATITDDGEGFDPETTLVAAARGGHLGLVGMHERVQMLGGRTHIDSRPGGPTMISAELPPFTSAD